MSAPRLSTEQMIALHGFFAEAVVQAEASLGEIAGSETEVEVTEVHCTALADLGEEGLRVSEDLVAGIMGRLEGPLPGSLALAVDPEEALAWARGGQGSPLDTFVALGRALLSALAGSICELLEEPTRLVAPDLVELPELTMLLRTHAPLDTLIVSLRLRVELADELIGGHVHLLIEPKSMARLLSGLSAAVH